MWRPLVGLLVASCGAPTPPRPLPAAVPVPALAVAPYAPPAATPLPPAHIECHAFPGRAPMDGRGKRIFDFAPLALFPIRKGPRIGERPRIGLGRTTPELRGVFAQNASSIASCWKHASSLGAAPTTLAVGLTIEPLGDTRDLTVTSERADDAALAACVRASLSGASFTGTTTHPLHLTAELAFTRADQPAWARTWPAPRVTPAADRRRGIVCSSVVDDGHVPQVALPRPLEVSDWDVSRIPPRRGMPSVRLGCTVSFLDTDKRAILTAIEANRGALQRCYADAVARDPSVSGQIELQLAFDPAGTTSSATVTTGAGDAALHACLVAAMMELWVVPAPRSALEVNVPFTLEAPAPASADPAVLLAHGDAEAALQAWTSVLRGPVSAELACRGRAGVLLAIARLAPWLDDPRFAAAIVDLARAAEVLAPDRARACVAPVEETIARFTRARGEPADRYALTHVWLARYTAALPLAPFLADGAALRWFHAAALLRTPRRAEARTILVGLARDPDIGPAVARSLDESPHDPIADRCLE